MRAKSSANGNCDPTASEAEQGTGNFDGEKNQKTFANRTTCPPQCTSEGTDARFITFTFGVRMEKVVGIGGVFFKARDPKALAAWYREHLGVPVEPGQTYGAFTSATAGEQAVWSAFSADTSYFGGGPTPFMVNYRVSNLDAMLAQLRAAGVNVDDRVEDYGFGRFGWATDPEGNRFELWEPRSPAQG